MKNTVKSQIYAHPRTCVRSVSIIKGRVIAMKIDLKLVRILAFITDFAKPLDLVRLIG